MPILASSKYPNAYGKASIVATAPSGLDSMNNTQDVFVVKYNSAGKALWSARIASMASDLGYGITTDSNGNVYVTGSSGVSEATTAFNSDGSPFAIPPFPSRNGDAFIVKYNKDGAVQWTARVSSTGIDVGYGIVVDSAGDVYVTGNGDGTGAILTAFSSNGVAFGTTLANSGSSDIFIVKYNTNGIVQWVTRIASSGFDTAYGIATDSSGNIYICGQGGSSGAVTAFNSNGVAFSPTITNSGRDVIVVKYNTSGFVQWVARLASAGEEIGHGIATDSGGNVYIVGVTPSATVVTAFSSNGVAFSPTIANSGNTDAFLVKYNINGIVQWVARVASIGGDVGYGIATDVGGNVYVTGEGGSGSGVATTAFSSNGNAFSPAIASSGSSDAFVVKYNTSGIVQWATKIASTGLDIGFAISTDSDSNVYVTGQGGVNLDLTAFNANGTAFATTISSSGEADAFLVKYNTSGVVQWVTRMGSSGQDIGKAITVGSDSSVYVTGHFTGGRFSVYGQALSIFSAIPNSGGTDAFLAKYNTNGTPQWTARVASTAADIGYGVVADLDGNLYLTGQGGSGAVVTAFSSNGVAFSPTLANSGGTDVFVAKYNTSGTVQWLARVASTAADIGFASATDSAGNVYVTGQGGTGAVVTAFSSNGVAFSPTLANSGGTDVFIAKYDTNGIVQWVARVASTAADIGYGIASDSMGNVYVTGQCGTGAVVTAFSSNEVAFSPTLANSGDVDVFLVKYNTNGIVQWVARVASTGIDVGFAVATDSSDNVYITGRSGTDGVVTTAFSSDGVAFSPTITNVGGTDAFIAKYNTNGIAQWITRISTSASNDFGYSIATDSSGNVYVTGDANGATTVFSSNGIAFGRQLRHAFVVKYDTNGIVVWAASVEGSTAGEGFGIAVDSVQNVYVTGRFTSDSVGIFNSDSSVFARVDVRGVFVVKYTIHGFAQWVQVLRGLTSTDAIGRAIDVDLFGNSYITGSSPSGQALQLYNIDTTPYLFVNSSGGTDGFVVKYSPDATPRWVAKVSSIEIDTSFAIATDSDGNVYIAGQRGRAGVFTLFNADGTPFGTTFPVTGVQTDAFIAKYNTDGAIQWAARIVSVAQDIAYGIASDSSGNVYVTGMCSANANAVTTAFSSNGNAFATTITNANTAADTFLVKYDTDGIVQWVASIRSNSEVIARAITVHSSGDIYLTGNKGPSTTIVNSNATTTGAGQSGAFTVKFNTSGIAEWVRQIGSAGNDVGYGVTTDPSGNVYVTGVAGRDGATTIFVTNGGNAGASFAASGSGDAYVAKYNSSAVVQWAAKIASAALDTGFAIASDSAGNVYVTGQGGTGTVVTAFSSNGVAFSPTIANSGGTDAFLVKYNTNGIVQWVTRVGGSGADIGYGVATDSGGNVYLTGQSGDAISVSVFNADGTTFGTMIAAVAGGTENETFMIKYNSSGVVQWISGLRGPGGDGGRGISLDPMGNIYMTGQFAASGLVPYDAT
jgi:hypothetical protein